MFIDNELKTISNLAKIASKSLEKITTDSTSIDKFQQQISSAFTKMMSQQDYSFLVSKDFQKQLELFSSYISQAEYNTEDVLNNAISKILSIDISTFNNQVQHLYDNMPENIENNIDDNTAKIAEIVYNVIEKFNANTTEKVKIPFCETSTAKNFAYILAVFVAIAQILFYSGYNIKEDFIEPITNTIENSKITDITNE